MKVQQLRFAEFLQEYRQVEMSTSLPAREIASFLSDTDNLRLLRAHGGVTGEERFGVIYYEYDLHTSNQKCYIIATHVDNKPVGYMMLSKLADKVWQVMSTEVYKPYAGKGLGTDFYIKVIKSDGIKLVNGGSLSKAAEGVWTKLRDRIIVRILDTGDMSIYSFDEIGKNTGNTTTVIHPKDDHPRDDKLQRFFYIAESRSLNFPMHENLNKDESHNIQYELWLQNKASIMYPRMMTCYSEDGEF